MDIGRLGVWTFGFAMADEAERRDALAELEELGYTAAWFPGGGQAFGTARQLLEASSTLVVATGIASIWTYDVDHVAAEWTALRKEFGERFLLGLGVSHPEAVNRGGASRYSRPVSAMTTFLDGLDAALADGGERVLAALGPRMLELAGSRARGAHPYFAPVEHSEVARTTLGAGPLLAPEHAVVLETDPDRARSIARNHMGLYLRLQNYTNNLRRLGYTDDDLRDGGSDRLVDAIVLWGSPETVAERIRAHYRAGADHVCVQVLQQERGLPRRQWRELAQAMGLRD